MSSDRRGGLGILPAPTSASWRLRPRGELPFPLDRDSCVLHRDTRRAAWHGFRMLGLDRPGRVLVPALHDGRYVEGLVRLGLTCDFYEVDDGLQPVEEGLDELVTTETRALYLVHYLGLPQDAARWRAWCDASGLRLIEDASQSWLATVDGRPVGSFGDMAFFSLAAMLPIPDGGAVTAAAPDATGGATSGEIDSPPSAATRFLLPRIADPHVAEQRRAHFRLLLDELPGLVAPYALLAPGACPFVFPLDVDDRSGAMSRLRDAGISAAELWPRPHPQLRPEHFPATAERRARGVALPLQQEMRPSDLARVAHIARGRAPGAEPLTLEPIDSIDALGDEWDDRALASRNLFATREWLSTWSRHRLGGRPIHGAACRTPGGRLVAILALYSSRAFGLRVLRFLGHGPSDELGPICARVDHVRAARALRRFVADGADEWDVLIGHHLPGEEAWDALLGGRILRREASPIVRLSGRTWDDFLASLNAGLRREIRSDPRRLEREHAVTYRLADDPNRLDADLDTLFALHEAQWGPNSTFRRWEPFHREFAAVALVRGWLRFWLLEVDGRPVAAQYNFRYAQAEFSYQVARDLSWKRVSVGSVLLMHAMRTAFEDGVREYRLLRGGEAYKFRFPIVDAAVDTVGVGRGRLPSTALALGDLATDLPGFAPARRRVGARLRS